MTIQQAPQLLILQKSADISEHELRVIQSLNQLHGIEATTVNLCNHESIAEKTRGKCFQLVYLCGHGNIGSFGESGNCESWSNVAADLCSAACTQNATIFCACCRGGLQSVAKAFFDNCSEVAFVCGPRADTYPNTLILGFHVFLYGLLFRRSDAETAAEAASHATGYKFQVHDRQTLLDAQLCAVRGDANES